MIKVNWDVEELVALIDVYRRSDEKSAEQIEVELLALSKAFVERAERLGIEHDEKYRNLNGMKMMFQNVAYVASNGDHGMSAASSAMRKVYDMSNSSPEVFDLILKTIVCGHWHTSYGHSKYEHKGTEFGEDADFSPYYGPGIIAIDACTAFSGKVNCLVIED